jgi:hypothetical protein
MSVGPVHWPVGVRNLKPESADTLYGGHRPDAGWRAQPVGVDRLLQHQGEDYIGTIDTNTIISQCFSTGSPYYCGLFHRDPLTGDLRHGLCHPTTLNTGYLRTRVSTWRPMRWCQIGNLGRLYADFIGT